MANYIFNDENGIYDRETFDAVRSAINHQRIIPSISKINLESAHSIKHLDLFRKKGLEIENLEFLKFFPNLISLEIRSGRLHDLTPLAHTPKLDLLMLHDADIDSLKPLLNLEKLTTLNLENVNVRNADFSVMGNLKTVERLSAYNCGITSIEWIAGMESLKVAGFDGNTIKNFAPLKNTKKLEMVSHDQGYYEKPFDNLL